MSILDFFRRPAPSPTINAATDKASPGFPDALDANGTGSGQPLRPVAPGLTVEMKLRGRMEDSDRQPGLPAAENRLKALQLMSRNGSFSGHPEDMLEDLDHAEAAVRRLRSQ